MTISDTREGLSCGHWWGLPLDIRSRKRKGLPSRWPDTSHCSKQTSKWQCKATSALLFIYVCIYSLSAITALMQDHTVCGISCKERARRSQNTSTASYQCTQEHPVQNLRNFLSRQTCCISCTNLEAYTLGLQSFTQKMHMHTHSLQSDSQPLRTNCHNLAFSK